MHLNRWLIFMIVLFSSGLLSGGSLFVGEKVIYGGGADTPPQEKDIGVKMEADVTGIGSLPDPGQDRNMQSALESFRENDFQKAAACLDRSMDNHEKGSSAYRKALLLWGRAKLKLKDFAEAISRLEEYQKGLVEKDPEIENMLEELRKKESE